MNAHESLNVVAAGAGRMGRGIGHMFAYADHPVRILDMKARGDADFQRLRDEAHRFAIGTHRAKRGKAIQKSILDDVPGVGAKRKKALLHHFGSAKAVSTAGLADLEAVEGINTSTAKTIYDYFHDEG